MTTKKQSLTLGHLRQAFRNECADDARRALDAVSKASSQDMLRDLKHAERVIKKAESAEMMDGYTMGAMAVLAAMHARLGKNPHRSVSNYLDRVTQTLVEMGSESKGGGS